LRDPGHLTRLEQKRNIQRPGRFAHCGYRRDWKDNRMVTATALGLLAPLALFAALGLNGVLLWRAAPSVRQALAGPVPTFTPACIVPDGEANVVALRPGMPAGVRARAVAHPSVQLHPLAA
jgi:hypothetical protein